MKTPFTIYAQAYGIYLLLTIPALAIRPVYAVYAISAAYAFVAGFVAMIVFALVFLLHLIKPHYKTAIAILFAGVLLAVGIGFKLLLLNVFPYRSFWEMDGDTLFPIAGILAGCIAAYINIPRIRNHFSPVLIEEINTIGLQP